MSPLASAVKQGGWPVVSFAPGTSASRRSAAPRSRCFAQRDAMKEIGPKDFTPRTPEAAAHEPDGGHNPPDADELVKWMADRFAGKAPQNDC